LLQVGLLYAVVGVVGLIKAIPNQIDAAAIESGQRPRVWRSGQRALLQTSPYLIVGRLLNARTVAVPGMTVPHVCAPLVSEGAASGRAPMIYFLASAPNFASARAENRFVGRLSIGPNGPDTSSRIATACGLRAPTYLLLGDSEDTMTFVWWWAIAIGVLLAAIGLVAWIIASRRARAMA